MRLLPLVIAALFAASGALAAERTVTDDAGRSVTIPAAPERIVVLHEALLGLPVLDLGLPLLASYGRADNGEPLGAVDYIRTVMGDTGAVPVPTGIGPVGQIDLERLNRLAPDLIIGTGHDRDKVDALAAIAPLYLKAVRGPEAAGFAIEADLAEVLGRETRFAARKADYLERVAGLRPAGGQTYLAVILTDEIRLVGDTSGAVAALEDLGYARLPIEGNFKGAGYGANFSAPLSPEILGRLDPDLLVVMNSYAGRDRDEAAVRTRLDRLMPGWERFLKPAREGRVLFLDSAEVASPTIASAHHTLSAYAAYAAR